MMAGGRFGLGTVTDIQGDTARVQIGNVLTDYLPWLTAAGDVRTWRAPAVGEQVAVLLHEGARHGVILGSVFQDAYPAPATTTDEQRIEWADGTVIRKTPAGVDITVTGNLNITASGAVVINGATVDINSA